MATNGKQGSSSSGIKENARFQPIEPLRAHEYVAEQIRRHIGLGLIEPGDSLPPERELLRLFGVGRGTLQAALRQLESDGLLKSKRGASGGTFVQEPLNDEASRQRSLLELKLSRDQITDALAFRRVVEEGSVRLAAENPTSPRIADVRAVLDSFDDSMSEREVHRIDAEFHIGVARATDSELLRGAVEASWLRLNEAILAQPETSRWRNQIYREHDAILAAIEAGNAKVAVRRISQHLKHTEKSIDALMAALG